MAFGSCFPSPEACRYPVIRLSGDDAKFDLLIPSVLSLFFDFVILTANSQSHVGAPFVQTFGETLKMMRTLFLSTDPAAQPLVVSGSGTLGWDFVAANLVERGDEVLVLHSGMRRRSIEVTW